MYIYIYIYNKTSSVRVLPSARLSGGGGLRGGGRLLRFLFLVSGKFSDKIVLLSLCATGLLLRFLNICRNPHSIV